jgi:hypothetical protein
MLNTQPNHHGMLTTIAEVCLQVIINIKKCIAAQEEVDAAEKHLHEEAEQI